MAHTAAGSSTAAPAAALAVMMVLKAIILRSIVWLVIMGWGVTMASAVLLSVVPIYDVCAATVLFDVKALKVKEAATIVSVAASLM